MDTLSLNYDVSTHIATILALTGMLFLKYQSLMIDIQACSQMHNKESLEPLIILINQQILFLEFLKNNVLWELPEKQIFLIDTLLKEYVEIKKMLCFYSNYNELDLKNDIYFYDNLTSSLKKAEILLQEFQKQYKKLKALHFNYTQRHNVNRRKFRKRK